LIELLWLTKCNHPVIDLKIVIEILVYLERDTQLSELQMFTWPWDLNEGVRLKRYGQRKSRK
jgi:hypothetical protein